MAEYTIVAKITKMASNSVFIKGVGKYAYENKWSVLEGKEPSSSKFDGDEIKCSIDNNNILKDVVVNAMINNKALKLTIAGEGSPYSITAVEMP